MAIDLNELKARLAAMQPNNEPINDGVAMEHAHQLVRQHHFNEKQAQQQQFAAEKEQQRQRHLIEKAQVIGASARSVLNHQEAYGEDAVRALANNIMQQGGSDHLKAVAATLHSAGHHDVADIMDNAVSGWD